jgi:hypothetical protein
MHSPWPLQILPFLDRQVSVLSGHSQAGPVNPEMSMILNGNEILQLKMRSVEPTWFTLTDPAIASSMASAQLSVVSGTVEVVALAKLAADDLFGVLKYKKSIKMALFYK